MSDTNWQWIDASLSSCGNGTKHTRGSFRVRRLGTFWHHKHASAHHEVYDEHGRPYYKSKARKVGQQLDSTADIPKGDSKPNATAVGMEFDKDGNMRIVYA